MSEPVYAVRCSGHCIERDRSGFVREVRTAHGAHIDLVYTEPRTGIVHLAFSFGTGEDHAAWAEAWRRATTDLVERRRDAPWRRRRLERVERLIDAGWRATRDVSPWPR